MKLEYILVATDFSEAGTYAVAKATAWARRYRAALHVVHVVPPKRWFAGLFGSADALHEAACNHAAMSLKEISEGIDTGLIPQITTGVLEGPAAGTIRHAAQVFNRICSSSVHVAITESRRAGWAWAEQRPNSPTRRTSQHSSCGEKPRVQNHSFWHRWT